MVTPSSFEELYPFQGRYLELDGGRMHYLDEGSGDPVVMVHGNPTWSFHFRELVRELRGAHRVIAPDHVGCGLSDKPPGGKYEYTLARRGHDLERLLDHLGIRRRITLVLHDWGGMIGLTYATAHPDRIARLVLLNTAGFPLPEGKKLPWELRLARAPYLGAFLVRSLNLFARGAARACVTRSSLPPAVRAAYLAPYDSFRNRIAVHRFVQDIPLSPRDPAYEVVARVERGLDGLQGIPLLLLWGERDFVFDRTFLAEWLRRFPHAEVHRFPDSGHYVLEDARDEVLRIVSSFLRRHEIAEEVFR
jgi:pimeloyl-ACP methyl ester carboxylesterase